MIFQVFVLILLFAVGVLLCSWYYPALDFILCLISTLYGCKQPRELQSLLCKQAAIPPEFRPLWICFTALCHWFNQFLSSKHHLPHSPNVKAVLGQSASLNAETTFALLSFTESHVPPGLRPLSSFSRNIFGSRSLQLEHDKSVVTLGKQNCF